MGKVKGVIALADLKPYPGCLRYKYVWQQLGITREEYGKVQQKQWFGCTYDENGKEESPEVFERIRQKVKQNKAKIDKLDSSNL